MKLYGRILLTFGVVIVIAVLAVALAVGRRAEVEFRSYHALRSNRAQATAQALVAYYEAQGGWEGVQSRLETLIPGQGAQRGGPGGDGAVQNQPGGWSYRIADASGRIVASTADGSSGTSLPVTLSAAERRSALPLESGDEVIGYLALSGSVPLDPPAQQFVDDLRGAVWFGVAVAMAVALLVGGLLARGIVAPVRSLTRAAQRIATGDLETRAEVRGSDEIAALAETFNTMTANLAEAETARQAQIADISHELRNPLAVLQGSLEALADNIYPPTHENVRPALDQVRMLNRLVEDLHTLALTDAGSLRLDLQPIDVDRFLDKVAEAHREAFRARGLTLHRVERGGRPLEVRGDYDRLTQVVNNVLGNALRYVPEGGTVRISAERADGGAAIRIADDGPGVPAADLPHLFERFWRGDPSRSRKTGGSGLGLTIARRIIEAHDGRIDARPTPGGGLTLRIWLPEA